MPYGLIEEYGAHLTEWETGSRVIRVELDRNVLRTHGPYDIRLFLPIEFATLFEEGLPVVVTLEQNGG